MIQPLDMWSIFVVYTFGSFWMAVFGIMGIYLAILLLGNVSIYSVINILLLFLLYMVLGYGNLLLSIPITIFIVVRFMLSLMNTAGGNSQ